MLSLDKIVNETDSVRAALKRRGEDPPLDEILALDSRRRDLILEGENLRRHRNEVSRTIGREKRKPTPDEQAAMRETGERIKASETELAEVQARLDALLLTLPNLPLPETPDGLDETANVIVRTVGEPRQVEGAQAHWDIGPRLDIMDMEAGARISGARFYLLKGKGARLQRALAAWMLDVHTSEHGYIEIDPPYLVRQETMTGSGNLPKFRDNLYHDDEQDLWLIPTSEVALNGIHQGQIIEHGMLPLKYVAQTPCFRKEHTAAGRDVRGMKRVHQFEKVEMFRYVEPGDSPAALEEMVDEATKLCERLGLAYRVLSLCAGDIGFQSARTYDIEVWAAGSQEWLEVSSISTCVDFQARRNNTRYRPEPGGSTRLPHTLNGSGLALPRLFIAVLENGQQPDGSVVIPDVLRPYTGFDSIS
ncbi:MAG: serine--tRNA ligase [Dehalococcoidia bacterium]